MNRIVILLAFVVVLLAVEVDAHPRGGRGDRPLFRRPGGGGRHGGRGGDRDSSSDHDGGRDRRPGHHDSDAADETDCDEEELPADEYDDYITEQDEEWYDEGEDDFHENEDNAEEEDDDYWYDDDTTTLGAGLWGDDLTTDVEQRRLDQPLEPYGDAFGLRMLEDKHTKNRLVYGAFAALGIVVLVLFVALIAYLVKQKPWVASAASSSAYAVKHSPKTPPPTYGYTEPADMKKVPLGEDLTPQTYENALTGTPGYSPAEEHVYQDMNLPTYSSLDLRRDTDPVPVYSIADAKPAVPDVQHM